MSYGQSTPKGKQEITSFLKSKLPAGAKICDMGAGGGTYYKYLGSDYEWTAVEIWHDAVQYLKQNYNKVYEQNIVDFEYDQYYDLVIFGDVLEHLTIEDAQKCVTAAKQNSNSIMIAIPFNYPQGPIYGNEAERHIQDKLTLEDFNKLYPGFRPVYENYVGKRLHDGYYYWQKELEK